MSKESRAYFRIVDHIGLRLYELTEEEYQNLKLSSQHTEAPKLDTLSQLNYQIQMVWDRLKLKNPDMAEFGKLLNDKVNYLAEHSEMGRLSRELDDFPVLEVDMSATGIAFNHHKSYERDTKVALDLLLPPNRQYMKVAARVVNIGPAHQVSEFITNSYDSVGSDGSESELEGFRLGLQFIDISKPVREYLIQYLVQRQGALIKAKRESETDDNVYSHYEDEQVAQ